VSDRPTTRTTAPKPVAFPKPKPLPPAMTDEPAFVLAGDGVPRRIKHVAGEGGWSEWVHPLPGYRLICCDCGLSHEMEFRVVANEVIFRARRHERSTAQVRRHMKAAS
jgi:hypothetical protein